MRAALAEKRDVAVRIKKCVHTTNFNLVYFRKKNKNKSELLKKRISAKLIQDDNPCSWRV